MTARAPARAPLMLLPRLPGRVWLLLGAFGLYTLSVSANMPYRAIFLHSVDRLPTDAVGEVLTAMALATVVASIAGGWLVDRVGGAWTLLAAGLSQAAGHVLFGLPAAPAAGLAGAVAIGAGFGGILCALRPLLVAMTAPDQRAEAFSLQYLAVNAGIGAGGLLGGLVLRAPAAFAFQALFWWGAAASAGVGLATVMLAPRGASAGERRPAEGGGGYRAVLADRPWLMLAGVQVLTAILITQINHAVPLELNAFRGVPEFQIGLLLLANAVAVMALQLPVTRLVARMRRSRAIGLTGAVWAVAWLSGAVSGAGGRFALPLLLAFYVLLAVGECLINPSLTVLMLEVAPEGLLGRYAGLSQVAWSLGAGVSPAVGLFVVGLPVHGLLWPLAALAAAAIVPWSVAIGAAVRPEADQPAARAAGAAA